MLSQADRTVECHTAHIHSRMSVKMYARMNMKQKARHTYMCIMTAQKYAEMQMRTRTHTHSHTNMHANSNLLMAALYIDFAHH